jgi:hypothetical protein
MTFFNLWSSTTSVMRLKRFRIIAARNALHTAPTIVFSAAKPAQQLEFERYKHFEMDAGTVTQAYAGIAVGNYYNKQLLQQPVTPAIYLPICLSKNYIISIINTLL